MIVDRPLPTKGCMELTAHIVNKKQKGKQMSNYKANNTLPDGEKLWCFYCAEYRNDIHPSEQHKHHKRCNRCRKARVRHTGTAGDFEIFEIG